MTGQKISKAERPVDHRQYKGHYGAFANTDAALRENRWSLCTTCRQDGRIYRSGNHAQAKALFIFAPARWPTTTATSSSTSS